MGNPIQSFRLIIENNFIQMATSAVRTPENIAAVA